MQRRAFVGAGATLATALVLGCDGGGDSDGGGGEGGSSSGGTSSGGTSAVTGGSTSSGGAPNSGGSASGGTETGGTDSGGSASGGADPGSGGGPSCEDLEVDIVTNHPHDMVVPVADLTLTEPKTYVMTGGHTHEVTLTVEDFQALAAGETVTKTSSFDAGHTHETTITCA